MRAELLEQALHLRRDAHARRGREGVAVAPRAHLCHVVRAARLRVGADRGFLPTAERLALHDRAGNAAVDVDVARLDAVEPVVDLVAVEGVDARGEAVPGGVTPPVSSSSNAASAARSALVRPAIVLSQARPVACAMKLAQNRHSFGSMRTGTSSAACLSKSAVGPYAHRLELNSGMVLPGASHPALPQEEPAATPMRSITSTSCPYSCRRHAVARPVMPTPTTRVRVICEPPHFRQALCRR